MSDLPQHIRDAVPGETTPISARDSVTADVVPNVGDTATKALRVTVVAGGTSGVQYIEGTAFVPGTSVGNMGLSVVDDGSVPVPASSTFTPTRIDPTTHGLIVGPQSLATVVGGEFAIIPVFPSQNPLPPHNFRWDTPTLVNGRLPVDLTGTILTVTQPFLSEQSPQVAPIVVPAAFTTSQALEPQTQLAVCLTSDGTVTSTSVTVAVSDGFGNTTGTLSTLTQADLGVLKPVTVGCAFLQVVVNFGVTVFGTGTYLQIAILTAP